MITLQLSIGHATATLTGWSDTDGNPHTGLPAGYDQANIVWSVDSPGGAFVTLTPAPVLGSNNLTCGVSFVGPSGSFNLTATATKAGSSPLTAVQAITLAGPVPASLTMSVS